MKFKINYKSKKTIIAIILLIVLFVAGFAGGYAWIKSNNQSTAVTDETINVDSQSNAEEKNNQVSLPNLGDDEEEISSESIDNGVVKEGSNTTNTAEDTKNSETDITSTEDSTIVYEQVVVGERLVAEDSKIKWTPELLVVPETNLSLKKPNLTVIKKAETQTSKLTGNNLVQTGEIVNYTIEITNNGEETLNKIEVSDMIPEGTTFKSVEDHTAVLVKEIGEEGQEIVTKIIWTVDVEPGKTVAVKFAVTVNEEATGIITNVAIANGEESQEQHLAIIEAEKKAVINNNPKIKTAKIGDEITYTISIKNTGDIAGTVLVKDKDLADILGNKLDVENIIQKAELIGKIMVNGQNTEYSEKDLIETGIDVLVEANQTAEVVFTVKVKEIEGNITNAALIGDGKPTDPVETDTVNITARKENDKGNTGTEVVRVGEEIVYTIYLSNNGNKEGTTTVTDILPTGVTFVNASNGGKYSNGKITWKGVNVLPGIDKTKLTVTVKVNEKATERLINTVKVEAEEITDKGLDIINVNSTKKSYTEADIIEENGKITFKESSNNKVRPEERIFYEITVKNLGDKKVENIEVTDTIPKQTKLLNIREEATVKDDKITWRIDIPSKQEVKLVFSVQVDKDAEGIIKNVAIVDNKDTNEVENQVIKPHIVFKKESTPKTNTKVQYGDIITYKIIVENDGNDSKEVEITDNIPENTIFYSVQNGGEEVKDSTGKTVGVKWVKTVKAKEGKNNGKVEVTFKVQVKGNITEEITNIAKVDNIPTNDVNHTIEKQVDITANNYTGKNIVIVLDLSSSMLQVKKSSITESQAEVLGEYNKASENDYIYPKNASNSKELPQSKLAKAKTAIKQFAKEALKDNRNTITLVTFNYSNKATATKGINQYSFYKSDREAHPEIEPYIGTNVLLTQETSIDTINKTVDGIRLRTRYLLTNIVGALDKTNDVIENTLVSDKRDIEVIFIGDGKPSYNTENCANQNNGFYSYATTMSKINSESVKIRTVPKNYNLKSNLYTLEYDVPLNEVNDAREAFANMTSKENRHNANSSTILNKLKLIAQNIEEPPIPTYPKNDESGIAIQEIPDNTELAFGIKPITLTVSGEKTKEFKSLAEIEKYFNETGRMKFENNMFIFDVKKFPAESSIKLDYYYIKAENK